jgi:tetratricopeptide (TPR) repeat protein
MTLLRHALRIALESDVPSAALRAQYNVSNNLYYRDQLEEAVLVARDGLALARKRGDRNWEWSFLAMMVGEHFMIGEWDEALELAAGVPHVEESASTRFAAIELLIVIPPLHIARGDHEEAAEILDRYSALAGSADVQERAAFFSSQATVLRSAGDLRGSLKAARQAIEAWSTVGAAHQSVKLAFVQAGDAALELGDAATVEELLSFVDGLGAGRIVPFLRSQSSRLRARLAAARGDLEEVEPAFAEAERICRDVGVPFWLATCLVEHAEWLAAQNRADEAGGLLAEARERFEQLEAKPWLDRVDALEAAGRPSRAQ